MEIVSLGAMIRIGAGAAGPALKVKAAPDPSLPTLRVEVEVEAVSTRPSQLPDEKFAGRIIAEHEDRVPMLLA